MKLPRCPWRLVELVSNLDTKDDREPAPGDRLRVVLPSETGDPEQRTLIVHGIELTGGRRVCLCSDADPPRPG